MSVLCPFWITAPPSWRMTCQRDEQPPSPPRYEETIRRRNISPPSPSDAPPGTLLLFIVDYLTSLQIIGNRLGNDQHHQPSTILQSRVMTNSTMLHVFVLYSV
jgi:hypothetical protein